MKLGRVSSFKICLFTLAQAMVVLEAAIYRKAVSYISQADALNFLLNLHTWSWHAKRFGASCRYREKVECRKTFQALSQEDKPWMWHFFHWEGTKAKVVAS